MFSYTETTALREGWLRSGLIESGDDDEVLSGSGAGKISRTSVTDISSQCVPGRRAERTQASGLSSGLCASAAPGASASPSPAPGGAVWPAVFASPGTPAVQ